MFRPSARDRFADRHRPTKEAVSESVDDVDAPAGAAVHALACVDEVRFRGQPAVRVAAGELGRDVPARPRDDRRLAPLPRSRAPGAPRRPAGAPGGSHDGPPAVGAVGQSVGGPALPGPPRRRRPRRAAVAHRRQRPAHPRTAGGTAGLAPRSILDPCRPGDLARGDRRGRPGLPVPAPHRGGRGRPRPPADARHDRRPDRPAPGAGGLRVAPVPPAARHAPARHWHLRLPARTHLALDDRGIPTGGNEREPAEAEPIGRRTFDDLYRLGRDRELALATDDARSRCAPDPGTPTPRCGFPPAARSPPSSR